MRFIMIKGKEEGLLQTVRACWHTGEFSFILHCVKELTPHPKEGTSLKFLGSSNGKAEDTGFRAVGIRYSWLG